jgi:hypothetical protein
LAIRQRGAASLLCLLCGATSVDFQPGTLTEKHGKS